jgi:hypothetical protein
MVVSGALLLIFCFWSPLVACSNPLGDDPSLTGPQIVEASLHDDARSDQSSRLWVALALIPLIGLGMAIRGGRAVLQDAAAGATGASAAGLVVIGLLLAALWGAVKYANASMTSSFTVVGPLYLTNRYWMMWAALVLLAAGFRMERQEATAWLPTRRGAP